MWQMYRCLSVQCAVYVAIMIKIATLFFLIFNIQLLAAQAKITQTSAIKNYYSINDTIVIDVVVKLDPLTCTDGMQKTKTYLSGFKIYKNKEWVELKKGYWKGTFTLLVVGNRKQKGCFTVVRVTDKDQLKSQFIVNTK